MNTDWINLNFIQSLFFFARQAGVAVIIFAISIGLARLLKAAVSRFSKRRKLPADVTQLLLQVAEVSLLLFGAITALGTMGVDIGALIAGLGLAGFAIGYALKDLLSNLIAGLLILLYTPFSRGDVIRMDAHEGTVSEINLRYTVLQSAEGKRILIPNSSLFTNVVIVNR